MVSIFHIQDTEWQKGEYEHKREMRKLQISLYITLSLILLLFAIIVLPYHTASEKAELIKTIVPVVTFGFGYLFGERKRND